MLRHVEIIEDRDGYAVTLPKHVVAGLRHRFKHPGLLLPGYTRNDRGPLTVRYERDQIGLTNFADLMIILSTLDIAHSQPFRGGPVKQLRTWSICGDTPHSPRSIPQWESAG